MPPLHSICSCICIVPKRGVRTSRLLHLPQLTYRPHRHHLPGYPHLPPTAGSKTDIVISATDSCTW